MAGPDFGHVEVACAVAYCVLNATDEKTSSREKIGPRYEDVRAVFGSREELGVDELLVFEGVEWESAFSEVVKCEAKLFWVQMVHSDVAEGFVSFEFVGVVLDL